mmetsp:Transcript_33258/g.71849  ORF Transcript_33258/g.71849 Transcript_33258/m.71849 type:complete len:857 (+) Transcript_33258:17-2587(+)
MVEMSNESSPSEHERDYYDDDNHNDTNNYEDDDHPNNNNSISEFSYGYDSDEEELDAAVISALRSNRLECDAQALRSSGCTNSCSGIPTLTAPTTATTAQSRRSRTAIRRNNLTSSFMSEGNNTLYSSMTSESSVATGYRRTAITGNDLEDFITEKLTDLESATKRMDWLKSFKDLDPRYQILEFFNELSLGGVEVFEADGGREAKSSLLMPKILRGFIRSGIFSVWRPTSNDAIRKMITGEGTGKGLDIKGKSAKRGIYSGFVPFLQIHDNAHKEKVGTMRRDKRVRVFYPNKSSRDMAASILNILGKSMIGRAETAMEEVRLEKERREELLKLATLGPSERTTRRSRYNIANIDDALNESIRCMMNDPTLYKVDDYAETSGVYGLDIPEKLFWEGYVVPHDISREGEYETGRPSMPEFQVMNFDTLRKGSVDVLLSPDGEVDGSPRPVLWHGGCGRLGEDAPKFCNPMCPLDLLMAYEESNTVTPVVSDFDCFLLGTRGVKYQEPLGEKELSVLSWCVDEIEGVLETPMESSSWTTRWLDVKKKNIDDPIHKDMPLFGYADPRSYSIMKGAVHKLKSNGAVRHGPECFNYGFPQELDDYYLVISDTFDGIPWRYTNAEGLIDILCDKIDTGFTFPLNPKWILCDPGWKKVYDKLMASQKPNVQDSLSIWYPRSIRDRIDEISTKHPQGFIYTCESFERSVGERSDLAQLELKRYEAKQSSIRKLSAAISRTNVVSAFTRILEEMEEDQKEDEIPHAEEAREKTVKKMRSKMEDFLRRRTGSRNHSNNTQQLNSNESIPEICDAHPDTGGGKEKWSRVSSVTDAVRFFRKPSFFPEISTEERELAEKISRRSLWM